MRMRMNRPLVFFLVLLLLQCSLEINAQEEEGDRHGSQILGNEEVHTNNEEETEIETATVAAPPSCKKSETIITDKQDKAPTNINYIQRVIFEKLNRESQSTPITSVEIEYPGSSIHQHTGEHIIQARISRGEEEEECFEVTFVIEDVDECSLEEGHGMRHACASSSTCVNTNGAYECICPLLDGGITTLESMESRSNWEVSLGKTSFSCSGKKSTLGCCDGDAHSVLGQKCRSAFQCPANPCSERNSCEQNAECVLSTFPPEYSCRCPNGYLGNGHKCGVADTRPDPKITSEGNPTEETQLKLRHMCGCTRPTVDLCASVTCGKHESCVISDNSQPQCICANGYFIHPDLGCIDERPPNLILNCDPYQNGTTILSQGDEYNECSVTIEDSNPEEYMRSLKLSYNPSMLVGCLKDVGEYEVTYTIATSWTIPPFTTVNRKVVVGDLDECTLTDEQKDVLKEKGCESLIPQCIPEATCKNTIGKYDCECPKYTSGDGFLNGTGCVDTHPPSITLLGPTVKLFRTAATAGLAGILSTSPSPRTQKEKRRARYEDDINYLMTSTKGNELCATPESASVTTCVTAVDVTPFGTVDLTDKVTLGALERVDDQEEEENQFIWKIGYDVADDAGNKATVYRTVQVVEVTLDDMEKLVSQTTHPIPQKNTIPEEVKACPKCENCQACPLCTCPPPPKIKTCPLPSPQSSTTCNAVEELNKFTIFVHSSLPAYSVKILYGFFAFIAFLIVTYLWSAPKEQIETNGTAQHPNVVYYTSPDGRVMESPRRYTPSAETPTTAGMTPMPPPTNSIMSPGLSYTPYANRSPQDIYER